MTSAARTRPTTHRSPPSAAVRRAGYVAAVVFDALCLLAINAWPGWDVLPFLSSDTDRVIGLVNVSILVHLALFAIYTLRDPRALRAAGDVVTSAIGVAVATRIWQVYPFETADDWSGWGLVAHLLVGLGVVGSVIGVISGLVRLGQAGRPGQ